MKLRVGYFISGIATGLVLLVSFISSLPDGRLHMVFCDVGQGDAAYIRFPDGRDALIDGGPNAAKLLTCLGENMPFWDRTIDIVILTHPQKDHMEGLLTIFKRFGVRYFAYSNGSATDDGKKLLELARTSGATLKRVSQGDTISLGNHSTISILWPPLSRITDSNNLSGELNDTCVVSLISYGVFDALFMGDADSHSDDALTETARLIAKNGIDILKVPHHGSKTGMTSGFLSWVRPSLHSLSVISVGKNSYGHPAQEIIDTLTKNNWLTKRTDTAGTIEVTSDGNSWSVLTANP